MPFYFCSTTHRRLLSHAEGGAIVSLCLPKHSDSVVWHSPIGLPFKNLKAKQQAEAGGIAVIVSSTVGVVMAFCGAAYWSLATQGLVYVGINTFFQWYFSPWRPTVHGITFAPVRHMFRFSCKILATTIMTCVNNNVLNILLGHYFSPRDTGNYNQAYQWNTKCYSLVQVWWRR